MKSLIQGLIVLLSLLTTYSCQSGPEIEFIQKDNQIDVMVDGRLFTNYLYGKQLSKPIMYPVQSPSGEVVTRWYPFKEVEGESQDHPHHRGVFFTYGSNGEVNGNNFWWNLHDSRPPNMDVKIPQIRQVEVLEMKGGKGSGRLLTLNHWIDSAKNTIIEENRLMEFYATENEYKVDFTIRLSATDNPVTFEDTKEGMFAIRVADWLAENSIGTLFKSTGEYMNAEGERTEKGIWGKRSSWLRLEGKKDGKTIGVAIFHHPQSVNYPTYWHARGYGCFAANPIGQYKFQTGTGIENPQYRSYTLKPGESGLFRFMMIIYEGSLTKQQLDKEFENFSNN